MRAPPPCSARISSPSASDFDRTTVTKTETGQRIPSLELAEALDTLFPHLDGLFARLAAHARHADGPRSLFTAGRPGIGNDELDRLVAAWLSRQAIFGRPEPPHCVVVIDESALRRRIGTPQAMHDQLTRLAEMAAQPYVTLQVVPYGPTRG